MGSALSFPVVFSCRSWFEGHELAGKLRAIQTVSCLLQGPSDAGNRVLELEGIMDSVLSLCASVSEAHQLVAVEALIHAADKAKRASFITANGVSLLKEIYKHSERDSICIRALVVSVMGAQRDRRGGGAGQTVAAGSAALSPPCWGALGGALG